MKKLRLFLIAIVAFLGLAIPVIADSDVDYSVSDYDGVLTIHDDNTADFYQTITYDFDSSYNGQIVTLGEAGHMPDGFTIDKNPEISAQVNGVDKTVRSEIKDLGDGYQVKIYNSGRSGDIVVVKLHWKLANLLFPYQDVAELNWVPISDWDETLKHVTFTVTTDKLTSNRKLWAHRGYLKSTLVKKQADGYQITASHVDGKLELHAYWDKDILTTPATLSGKKKAAIIKQEQKIARKTQLLKTTLFYVVPSIIGVMIVSAGVLFFMGNQTAKAHEKFSRDIRSYEAPEDWSPLLVMQYIYDADLEDTDTKGSSIPQKFKFETAMQATLLDLIDRKIITAEEQELTCHPDKPMTKYEAEVLDMAFGKRKTVKIEDLFSDYRFDDDLVDSYKKKYKGHTLEAKLNKLGDDFNDRYLGKLEKITGLVDKEISQKALPAIREDLPDGAAKKFEYAKGLLFISLLPIVVGLVYLIFNLNLAFLGYGFLLLLVILSLVVVIRKADYYDVHGAITAEGQERIQSWISFTNMMRDINKFDKVDWQGVIVWNRILVYATLFGYAKQVQKYLAIHDIKLASEAAYMVDSELGYLIGMQTHQLGLASHSADSASNFSVSSGSSGTSGGFSGGGGGGGGGAF
ncbi:hypothetical protein SEQ01_16430 [Streptococcus equinus]|uniref:DUF2207 domain-containing protein n=1 Tax=Streptococcus equinus TaxID=1335 RepID=UPI0011429CAA|nr:DUF2207 domain-containing protein [Streptococcus equinus]GEB11452.1 hypothetical protein SEQ01_16430 [Streptococcus equinus]